MCWPEEKYEQLIPGATFTLREGPKIVGFVGCWLRIRRVRVGNLNLRYRRLPALIVRSENRDLGNLSQERAPRGKDASESANCERRSNRKLASELAR